MRIAVITNAGISSRFNQGVPEEQKVLKCLYTQGGKEDTLLYHLMEKCAYADRIILVGGYRYDQLCDFYKAELSDLFPDVELVFNPHYADLGSGYSLYLGIDAAVKYSPDEILFVEGDLDIDNASFERVVKSGRSVLTYTTEPIYANKAVVLYQDGEGRYKYAFNSAHGLLSIDEPFSCILNSGQTWKFSQPALLKKANDMFIEEDRAGTNLGIIQRYIDLAGTEDIELVCLRRWTNCNTREDHEKIRKYWEAEK